MLDFDNKVIVITGGGSGLGLATAKEVAALGADVVITDYNKDNLDSAINELEENYPNSEFLAVEGDASKKEDVKNYVKQTMDRFGRIDGFYNNAGIEGDQTMLHETSDENLERVLDINFMGVYYGLREILAVMKEQGYGRIVNASSVAGIRAVGNISPYVATKHAVSGLTKSIAVEYASEGIIANTISPGAIKTTMVRESMKKQNPENPEQAEKDFASLNPTQRLGEPKEVGQLVAFLLSENNSYVNGQTIAIDGGQSNLYGKP
ncbi:MAG: glucose 1-dehydrogenase [Gracilimonas sp.]|uniref:glucose 1-dehydrogenase n=1 Tax=Gracilimonas sp. TaxID=1974203 RepID=UPI0037526C7F|nr:glucose 1-dehydrogenase [Gracilimonas sp.]